MQLLVAAAEVEVAYKVDKVDERSEADEDKLEDGSVVALVDVAEHVVIDLHVGVDARRVIRPILQLAVLRDENPEVDADHYEKSDAKCQVDTRCHDVVDTETESYAPISFHEAAARSDRVVDENDTSAANSRDPSTCVQA